MAMRLHLLLQTRVTILAIMVVFFSKSISISIDENFRIAMPNCENSRCGHVDIPFPFGTEKGCHFNDSFLVTCNHTDYDPPKPFLRESNIEILDIFLDGRLRVTSNIGRVCNDENATEASLIELREGLTINNTANKFTVVSCNAVGTVGGQRLDTGGYVTACASVCDTTEDLEYDNGPCSGLGCCQVPIPKEVLTATAFISTVDLNQSDVASYLNNCSYAFLVENNDFGFSPDYLSRLNNKSTLPIVVDWSIGDGTCDEAQKDESSYACKGTNSTCKDNDNGYGYRCSCKDGYHGNPYLIHGCQDIDECKDQKHTCDRPDFCQNTQGNFTCVCPKGHHGDGLKHGRGCAPDRGQSLLLKLVAGISVGVVILLLSACWLYMELNRRKLVRMKQKFFLQNGGLLLQEKLIRRDKSTDTTKLFTSIELKRATANFHASRIIGQGGFGTVYKGFLHDNRIVAVKKSKEIDPNQVEQFVNEVIVLSQINHRNVVKLLGCCLETQVPLLVYEFINNGTLFEHVNNKIKARNLTWDKRLTIAAESAGVLAYLHSAASPPIIHRDVKSANILLDANFTAKVSDFGASRLVPMDQTQLSTIVQGTFGYLDPEYMQTNQLTEKSDVYCFGVVLVELLTGLKALSYDRPEEERNLASYFLSTQKQGQLCKVLDNNIVCERNNEELILVSVLAKGCLQVKGDDRPSMKEVASELEALRVRGKHSWAQADPNAREMEALHSVEMNTISYGESTSTSIGYGVDSMRDHILLPAGGGR